MVICSVVIYWILRKLHTFVMMLLFWLLLNSLLPLLTSFSVCLILLLFLLPVPDVDVDVDDHDNDLRSTQRTLHTFVMVLFFYRKEYSGWSGLFPIWPLFLFVCSSFCSFFSWLLLFVFLMTMSGRYLLDTANTSQIRHGAVIWYEGGIPVLNGSQLYAALAFFNTSFLHGKTSKDQ